MRRSQRALVATSVGPVNDQYIKVAKLQGVFPWLSHANKGEVLLVLRGRLCVGRSEADGGPVEVAPSDFFVFPCGVRQNTSAAEETWIALIETVTTLHTGWEGTPMARSIAEQLR